MAKKESPNLEVHLGNDWYSGARLLRKVDNPHFLPEAALEKLPSSAKVMKDDELISVEQLRSNTEDTDPVEETSSAKVPLKKTDIKL